MLAATKQNLMPQNERSKRPKGRPHRKAEGPLELWFEQTGTNYQEASKLLRIGDAYLKQIAAGTRKPSEVVAASIELFTGRQVKAEEILAYCELRLNSDS